jgi:hypothetical protein
MTDLSYKVKWNSVIALEDYINPNKYTVKIHFDIVTDSGNEQNVAFELCEVFIKAILDNAILISLDNPLLPILKKKTKQRIVTLPTEPLDLVVAAMLYFKLNAITEERLIITQVDLKSDQGEDIWIHFDQDFAADSSLYQIEIFEKLNEMPWWTRSDVSHSDWFEENKKEIKFHKHSAEWDKTLLWDQDETKLEKTPSWKPKIIDGGKTQH